MRSWPVPQFVAVGVRDLVVGEVVRKWASSGPPKTGRIARIGSLLQLQNDWAQVGIEIYSAVDPKKIIRRVKVNAKELKAERMGPCGVPVCEAHGVDRGRACCSEHWHAWEKVA